MNFQPNPVALRESRALWRGERSFVLLLLYAGALALVAFLAYASEVNSAASYARAAGGAQDVNVLSSRVGRTLFEILCYVQLVAWLLIAPALSATSVSSERERGLLESLLMSHLKPREIVAGKFAASASFIALLIVATLPILALCFLFGGVSPGEFGGALAIQIATALCAIALGVWCSACLRLSTHALGATFGALALWLILSAWAFVDSGTGIDWRDHGARLIGLTNPFVGMSVLLSPERSYFVGVLLSASQAWPVCVAAQVLAGALFGGLAARRLSRPLAEDDAPAPRKSKKNGATPSAASASTSAASAPAASTSGGHIEAPWLRFVVFGGPLLRHHLRASWRWKRPRGRALSWWTLGALAFVAANAWAAWEMLAAPNETEWALLFTLLAVGLGAPVLVLASAGLSIARDRELGTWNGLRLSTLSSAEIVRAKIVAPIVAALGYSALLLPIFALGLLVEYTIGGGSGDWRGFARFISLSGVVWLLCLAQLSAWATLCSVRARRSSIALVAAFAGALIALFGPPLLVSLLLSDYSDYSTRRALEQALAPLHPFYALQGAAELANDLDSTYAPADVGFYAFSLAAHAFWAWLLYRAAVLAVARREK